MNEWQLEAYHGMAALTDAINRLTDAMDLIIEQSNDQRLLRDLGDIKTETQAVRTKLDERLAKTLRTTIE